MPKCFVSHFHFLLNLPHIIISSNPTPGILINRPNGTDVYKGVPKDYTGDVSASAQIFIQQSKSVLLNQYFAVLLTFTQIVWSKYNNFWLVVFLQDVTPENFLAVLKGDSSKIRGGSGKVLKRQVINKNKRWSSQPDTWDKNDTESGSSGLFWSNLVLFFLAAAPMIMCLYTSLTTEHLAFWLFLMMMWALFVSCSC